MIGNDQQFKGTSNKSMGLFRHTAEYGTRENLVFLVQCQAVSRRAPVSAGKKIETSLVMLRAHQSVSSSPRWRLFGYHVSASLDH